LISTRPARSRIGVASLGSRWTQLVGCQFAVVIFVEFMQRLGRVLDFFFVDYAVVIGIQRCEERRDDGRTAAFARTILPGSTLITRDAISPR